MNILAQHGFGPSDKIQLGLDSGVIQGAILSPRYIRPSKAEETLGKVLHQGAGFFLDPEYYASRYIGAPNSKLGSLEEWPFFEPVRRNLLVTGQAIPGLIQSALEVQDSLGVSGYIAPNVYVDHADSINAAISINFISRARSVMSEINVADKPLYCTLAIDRDAISDQEHFEDLVDALTSLDQRPDGFYILVGGGTVAEDGSHIRSDLYQERVLANWMYLNHVLAINGFRVINGCAEVFSPLLAMCGAFACATGWHGGQRQFSITGYVRPPNAGGRTPLMRYMSTALMGRIKQDELLDFREITSEVLNELESDRAYLGEPTRAEEMLQTWEALGVLSAETIVDDLELNLENFKQRIIHAHQLWEQLSSYGFSAGVEARHEQLDCLSGSIDRFKQLAELV
jgi:hypothetical protein